MNCVFCKIVSGEIPSYKVYGDQDTLAFLDINPVSEGHTLVIPKQHSEDLLDISDENVQSVACSVRKVARALKNAMQCDGISVLQANGKASGQAVFHYHVHVIPRMTKDGLPSLHGWPSAKPLQHGEQIAEKIAQRI